MKKHTSKLVVILGLAVFAVACSTKKDRFVNRNYHALTTKYNVLFNGNEAFIKGEEDLFKNYQDNFWDVLPIERVQDLEETMMPGQSKNENFVRAETKATKAIQKHSMNIGGQERNSQIDESYLLLGKARYHDGRFLPAIEALNYVMYKYPESSTISEVKLWKEKANIRLESNETAIEGLKELLQTDDKNFKNEILADTHATLAQAYYNINVVDTTITHLTIAKNQTKNNEKKARYNFVLGQLHNKINQKDSAYYYFQQVIDMKRKAPRLYTMQAHAEQAKAFDYKTGDTLAFVEKYKDLLEDRENRPYLDILNHQMGVFYDTYNDHTKATFYYKQSIKNRKKDNYLALSNYRNLGQLNFDERKFVTSGKYYDSSLVLFKGKEKEFFHIQRKRKNLDDVIKYEGIIANADSLTYVLNLSEPDRNAYYSSHVETLKAKDTEIALKALAEAKKNENMANNANNSNNRAVLNAQALGSVSERSIESVDMSSRRPTKMDAMSQVSSPLDVNTTNAMGQSTFYYYIPASIQQGKMFFERKWGKREYKEGWRWAASGGNAINPFETENDELLADQSNDKTEKEQSLIDLNDPKYKVETYTDALPKDDDILQTLAKDRNSALYELGFIYDEKFLEYQLAADRLEALLVSNPEERLVLPAKYNLYKIYGKLNAVDKADTVKNEIISEYPNTHYAKVLSGEIIDQSNSPEKVYKKLYQDYQNGMFTETLDEVNKMIDVYAGSDIIEKFEMLKARILARTQGIAAYKEAVLKVNELYPLTDEGKEAKRILEQEIPNLEQLTLNEEESNNWKMIYDLSIETEASIKDLTAKINKYIADTHNNRLKLSTDLYDNNKQLLVIHGFLSKETALAVNALLQDVKGYKVKQKGLPISIHNYKVIQIHKNLEQYIIASNK